MYHTERYRQRKWRILPSIKRVHVANWSRILCSCIKTSASGTSDRDFETMKMSKNILILTLHNSNGMVKHILCLPKVELSTDNIQSKYWTIISYKNKYN